VNRRRLVLVSALGAAVVAGALIGALVLTSGGSSTPSAGPAPSGSARIARLLAGIPQQGPALGSATAPVTLIEFADPQCPYCARWAAQALPTIVRRYVRTGKVRIVFSGMTFVGADSDLAFRTALAAGQQGRFWNVLELLFANQGTENTGWVTESLLRSIGDAVPGLDTDKMLAERDSSGVRTALQSAQALAQQAGVQGTPTFAVGRTGRQLRIVTITSLGPSGLTPSLDAALKG
jgi:protein-disulfide isomerase